MDITYRLGDDNYSDKRQQIYAIGANNVSPPTGEIDNDVQRHNELYSDLLLTLRHNFGEDIHSSLTLGNNIDDMYDEDVFDIPPVVFFLLRQQLDLSLFSRHHNNHLTHSGCKGCTVYSVYAFQLSTTKFTFQVSTSG